jgi:hypothetical protein
MSRGRDAFAVAAAIHAEPQRSQHRLSLGQLAPRPLHPPLVLLRLRRQSSPVVLSIVFRLFIVAVVATTTIGGRRGGSGRRVVLQEEHVVEPALGAPALGQLPGSVAHTPLELWVLSPTHEHSE